MKNTLLSFNLTHHDCIECILLTIIVGLIIAISTSEGNFTSWSLSIMKKEFAPVFKKYFSFMGVIIAVLIFVICLLSKVLLKIDGMLFLVSALIIITLYRCGIQIISSLKTKDYSRLKALLLFLGITLFIYAGVVWIVI